MGHQNLRIASRVEGRRFHVPEPQSGVYTGTKIPDPSGCLSVYSADEELPFAPHRMFLIYDVPTGGMRCNHAHREQTQWIVCASGRIDVEIETKDGIIRDTLSEPSRGVLLTPQSWLKLWFQEPNSSAVVLSSGLYDESEYIRDYDEFRSIIDGDVDQR
ncbi:MAG: WxcM-like domain-containing protein [Pseudomonadota bacterium]